MLHRNCLFLAIWPECKRTPRPNSLLPVTLYRCSCLCRGHVKHCLIWTVPFSISFLQAGGQEKKVTLVLCITALIFFFSFMAPWQLQVRKASILFSNSFFQLLIISKSVFSLRKFCMVFTLLLFLVFVCAVWLPHPDWWWKQPEATREAVFMVFLLWTRSTQNVTGSRPGSKLSCLILSEVWEFCLGEGTGDEAGQQTPCKLVLLLFTVYA